MTNSDYTDITVILDRSGSMEEIKKDMEGGFRQFIREQRAEPGECKLTVVQFDTQYELVHPATDIHSVPPLKLNPRGGTALLDAVGRAVTETGERLAALPEDQRPGNVIVMIITDGKENSSVEWDNDRVRELIKRQTDEWKWTFSYLGANQDAFAVARDLGVPVANTSGYTSDNAYGTFAVSSAAVSRTRHGGTYDYTDEEKESLNK